MAPLAALAMGAGLSGCGNVDLTINGEKGVPLSELDTSGAAPTELVVAASASVILTEGDTLDIEVEGDDEDALRFVLDNDTFGVTRDPDIDFRDDKPVVRVTMPAPKSITIAGSGTVEAATVASNSELAIGGSGSISIEEIAGESLEIAIGGSGSVKGAGTVERLEISIGGAGDVEMAGLKADKAEISIGGAGNVEFASDGEVEATIAGAGDVVVNGNAKCSVSAFGSGTLTCNPTSSDGDEPADEEAEAVLTDET
ncbi:head GIN domain-containing protein [Erythrobacter sp. GH1-10]|uniref:head GIN domain-containing protein n=1 Tax=Erythrobacter sp. GH1-10 TaxID=3349334 RepID=UPI0038783115